MQPYISFKVPDPKKISSRLNNLDIRVQIDWSTLKSHRPGIFAKYFLSFSQKNLSPEKNETNYVFTFQFLNDKIDQNTNFAKLPSGKWLFLV